MKNLSKIFMMVAALFAFACTTDVTEDLGVQLGDGAGQTTITVSLEESRTQLGEKAGELYPLYWSDGDKISVNGVESNEAVIDGETGSRATFTFPVESLDTPYCVAYPVAPKGQVVFPAKQNHVVAGNTFESGVSAMYGYAPNGGGVQMKHLTGILKIGIVGSATLSKVQVSTIDRAPIAGNFDFDFENGTKRATDSSKDVIEYSFGDGVQLSSEKATYIHVAVPAGTYDELYLTLYEKGSSGNIMYATIKAGDNKPLNAGAVREFKKGEDEQFVTYAPNAQLFVIDSAERLQAFKTAIESEEGLASDAVLTEDIDMTGVEWTPIAGESYVNTLIGNGYAIKGLKAPLFATTSASFKGVHLEDVDITITDRNQAGALACSITATDTISPKVENCSTSGTFTVKNENYALKADDADGEITYGGLVGTAYGTKFDECVNGMNITINQIAKLDEDKAACLNLGGIVGYCVNLGEIRTDVTNCTNNGDIQCLEKTNTNSRAIIGGLIGWSIANNYGAKFSGVNNGNILLDTTLSGGNTYISGMFAVLSCIKSAAVATIVENSTNNGDIVVTENTQMIKLHAGGVVCQALGAQMSNAKNMGAITVGTADKAASINALQIGGIAGNFRDGDSGPDGTVVDAINDAPISVWNNSTACAELTISGIIGWSQGVLTNVTNTEKGDISINGSHNLTSTETRVYSIAGLVGYKTSNSGTSCNNYGDITVGGTYSSNVSAEDAVQYINVGGHVGRSHQVMRGENHGNITFTGDTSQATKASLYIGGNVGYANVGLQEMDNHGKITISGNQTLSYLGGSAGYCNNGSSHTLENRGDIEISATLPANSAIGGLIGYYSCSSTDGKTFSNSFNYGNLTFTGSVSGGAYIGGLIGRNYAKLTNVGNGELDATTNKASDTKGKITIRPTVTADIAGLAGTMQLGGCVGDNKGTVTTMNNYGDILISSTISTINIGGCMNYNSGVLTTVKNYGDITLDENTKTSANIQIGGVLRRTINSLNGVENHGNIYIKGDYTETAATDIYVAGVLVDEDKGTDDAYLAKLKLEDVANYGDIEISAKVTGNDSGSHSCSIGGVANHTYGPGTNLNNYGDITFSGENREGKSVLIGGVLRLNDGIVDGATNEGNLTFSGISNGNVYLGGVIYDANTAVSNLTNGAVKQDGTKDTTKGQIKFEGVFAKDYVSSGKGTLYIGGIITAPSNVNRTNCTNYGDILVNPSSAEEQNIYNCFIGGMCYDGAVDSTWTNCHNHGDITLSENANLRNSPRIGGMVGKCEGSKTQTFAGCSNSGNITINGKTGVGLCNIGGITGTMTSTQGINITGGFVNSGDITFNAAHAATGNDVTLGGIIGRKTSSKDIASWEGEVVNTGTITYAGSCNRSAYIGGIIGQGTNVVGCTSLINTGTINCTGSFATSGYVGGIIGDTAKPISGAQCFCNVKAIGYTGVGMITGSARSETVVATNCQLGGTICTKTMGDIDEEGNPIPEDEKIDDIITLGNSNFFKYIYGSGNPASAEDANGCTYWSGPEAASAL